MEGKVKIKNERKMVLAKTEWEGKRGKGKIGCWESKRGTEKDEKKERKEEIKKKRKNERCGEKEEYFQWC